MRYKFTIEYDGSMFPLGWQAQKYAIQSVQSYLQKAAEAMTGREIVFIGAGRTDAGVHARGQVAHADFPKPYGLRQLHLGMNYHLSKSGCKIVSVQPTSADFHARFNATSKTYMYRIAHNSCCSLFEERTAWWIPDRVKIDWEKVDAQRESLLGQKDFTSLCDANDQSVSKIKTIDDIKFVLDGDYATFWFTARSFLHKQIRIMVGTLIDIGRGGIVASIEDILATYDRSKAGVTAPACGLTLLDVKYI